MTTLNLQVSASGDDSRTVNGTAGFSITMTDNPVGNAGGNLYAAWTRWTNVTVPQGATITSAVLSFYVISVGAGFGTLKLKSQAEDADNNTAPTSGSDANSRTLTTDTIWADITSAPTINAWLTQDITAAIQTVINRAGWSSGNAIGVRTQDNGSSANAYANIRHYNGSAAQAAKLDIDYTTGGGGGFQSAWAIGSNVLITAGQV